MNEFEIELNANLYSGWYEVHDKGLFLHNVYKRIYDETDVEVRNTPELKAVEEALENENSDEINEERERIFFVVNGRMPEREYDC